jgi:TRAP-type mannitol/chloroaromatic compound transport system substrate-binding protein
MGGSSRSGKEVVMSERAKQRVTRRRALTAAAGVGAGVALAGCTGEAMSTATKDGAAAKKQTGATVSGNTFNWKLQSTWPASDFHQVNPQDFAKIVGELTGGRLRIEVLAAGAVVPPLEILDAVHKGLLDAGNAWPGYWYGKHPAATLFGSAPGGPFGMNNEDYLGWIHNGGGVELYNELLQQELKLDVVAFPSFGETPEPLGWFPRPIRNLDDFKGLKFRATGMSAEVFKEFGLAVVSLAAGEIIPSLERKVIDASEYSDPTSDMALGFQDVLKFYHLPGIHQPTGIMEILINKAKWDELGEDLQAAVKYGAMATTLQYNAKILDRNSQDLETLRTKHGVNIVESPRDVLLEILKGWDKVSQRVAQENPFFAKVLNSQKQWAERVVPFRRRAHPEYNLAAQHYFGQQA